MSKHRHKHKPYPVNDKDKLYLDFVEDFCKNVVNELIPNYLEEILKDGEEYEIDDYCQVMLCLTDLGHHLFFKTDMDTDSKEFDDYIRDVCVALEYPYETYYGYEEGQNKAMYDMIGGYVIDYVGKIKTGNK